MYKKFLLSSFLLFFLIGIIYPLKKENIKLFNYCYSLEKVLSRNSLKSRENVSVKVRSIAKDIAEFGITQTKGTLVHKVIDQYKNSKNSFIVNIFPNKLYCLVGYWIENVKPGTFESIFYEKGKKTIDEYIELKEEVEVFLNDINFEYKTIKNEFEGFFKN